MEPNFAAALKLIDEAHAEDPNATPSTDGSSTIPYELHYATKMTQWLQKRCPNASPALRLACRAQHFRRWEIPRSSYPMTRVGYLTWRAKQKSQAAARVADLLASPEVTPPIPEEVIKRTASLIRKENLGSTDDDDETQVLEDVACLVFLDDQLDGFERRPEIDEEKMISILRKTWGKMSSRGQELALGMQLSDRGAALVKKALKD
ncbi:hypothetical protein VTK73DRAFT_3052 [Phialemonium thermophilum]|uniref:Glutamyl-tRNA synthetase n=1 Tax=Phialemonium thermophilum TaxID=223376 RepID=A0ABR3X1C0_9PEZI